jgi:hypothetical protein
MTENSENPDGQQQSGALEELGCPQPEFSPEKARRTSRRSSTICARWTSFERAHEIPR